jgi:hypothetical protein
MMLNKEIKKKELESSKMPNHKLERFSNASNIGSERFTEVMLKKIVESEESRPTVRLSAIGSDAKSANLNSQTKIE